MVPMSPFSICFQHLLVVYTIYSNDMSYVSAQNRTPDPRFVNVDGDCEGLETFHATREQPANTLSVLNSTAVHFPKGDKLCKIVRFYHDLLRQKEKLVT